MYKRTWAQSFWIDARQQEVDFLHSWAMLLPKLLGNCPLLGESWKPHDRANSYKTPQWGSKNVQKIAQQEDKAKGKFPGGYLTNILV